MDGGRGMRRYHIAQVSPLIQKVPIYIDTVWFGKVFGDQLADRGEVLFFFLGLILDVLEVEFIWQCWGVLFGHDVALQSKQSQQ